ncbi:MAG: hypothetical protein GXO89_15875 [Chlorobi bacterium]|nr:hypothetical protein [Chlorobiota bacterium]
MKKMITILMSISMSLTCFCQIPEITWQQCFGTSENDDSHCILKTGNGYLLGIKIKTNGFGISNYHGESDAWIMNIDTLGNILWERCFGGSESEGIYEIVKSSTEDEFYCFGYTESTDGDITCDTNYGSTDFWVVKIDIEGNILWDHCYGSTLTDSPRDAIATPDGGLLFMGRISAGGGDVKVFYGAYDIWFCKTDPLGNIEWEKTIGNEGIDNALQLKLISDSTCAFIGGYYEAGSMIDCEVAITGSGADLWLVEMNISGGDILNLYCYGGSYNDLGYYFEKIEDGYIPVSSTTSNDGDVSGLHGNPNYQDIWAVRIDEQGGIVWQQCLGGYSSETPYYVTQSEDGGDSS